MGNANKWDELYAANRKVIGNDPNRIFPGQRLTIPGKSSGDTPVTPPAPPAPAKGYVSPLASPVVTQAYANPSGGYALGCHTGSDLRAAYGTKLVAVSDGVIVASDSSSSYGINVQLRNADGTYSLYAHMSSKTVAAGQTVKAGEVVGYSGSTGNSTGPHLHFEIRTAPRFGTSCSTGGGFINPVSWLRSHGVTI
jgi:murein DD-endopeptidase MepM/ murein hydrolase activator NlpD